MSDKRTKPKAAASAAQRSLLTLGAIRPRPQDFTEFGELVYAKYFRANEKNGNFKAGIKAIVRAAAAVLSTHELKARGPTRPACADVLAC